MVNVETILNASEALKKEYELRIERDEAESFLKYIAFLWYFIHPDSEFSSITNFQERTSKCMKESGMNDDDTAKGFIRDDTKIYRLGVFEMFKIANNIAYEYWFSLRLRFAKETHKLRQGTSDDWKSVSDMRKELTAVESELFVDGRIAAITVKKAFSNPLYFWVEEFADENEI